MMNDGFSETIGFCAGQTTCRRCGKSFGYNSLKSPPTYCSDCRDNKDNKRIDDFKEG